jgi:hypothetical protein
VSKTNLNLLKYSFFNFSFSFLCSMSWLSTKREHVFLPVFTVGCHRYFESLGHYSCSTFRSSFYRRELVKFMCKCIQLPLRIQGCKCKKVILLPEFAGKLCRKYARI